MFNAEALLSMIKASNPRIDTDSFDFERPMSEQGVDSLDLSVVLLAVEEDTGLKVPNEDVECLTTAQDILAYVAARRSS